MAFKVFAAGALLRIALIIYGEWHDEHMPVKYTDIDYSVFSDAARYVGEGRSPYTRDTYRYTPLIAFFLVPNCFIHPAWGKFLFSAGDVIVGWLIQRICRRRAIPPDTATWCMAAWLFNPYTATVATRGNCEALVGIMMLAVVNFLMARRVVPAAFLFGLVVHIRLYPIIYTPSLLLFMDHHFRRGSAGVLVAAFLNRDRVAFAIISGITFMALGVAFFQLYGWDFLQETYLYHLSRRDPRHNFSIHFYRLYLDFEDSTEVGSGLEKFMLALPQLGTLLAVAFHYARDLPFSLFIQTLIFVTFNKVSGMLSLASATCVVQLLLNR
ncbi:hypothetical protein CYMTET_54310 [Cymbomonas tetramitiformis]|uniref:GPI mannosyltransferase 1 n=1 Tax=Cymbomonas tetramitiformis TaxID=36881 RepID=A0AAE0BF61_9CHLO|nr:hypothetical protein CYMTET_54310 [Cymbomonas tetramitiformis]